MLSRDTLVGNVEMMQLTLSGEEVCSRNEIPCPEGSSTYCTPTWARLQSRQKASSRPPCTEKSKVAHDHNILLAQDRAKLILS